MEIYAKMAKQLGWANWDEDNRTAAYKVIEKLESLQETVGFPSTIKELNISKQDLEDNMDTMVNFCFQDASGVMSPRPPFKEDYERLYQYAYEGKDIDF